MSDLRELYQEIILDHNKNPRNFNRPEGTNRTAEGYNPLCGDHYTIFLEVEDDRIKDVGFQGSGCAISKASASVMGTTVKGKTTAEADVLFESFREMVMGGGGVKRTEAAVAQLGKLAAFGGVAEFPSRVKCAILAWHALESALRQEQAVVSTE